MLKNENNTKNKDVSFCTWFSSDCENDWYTCWASQSFYVLHRDNGRCAIHTDSDWTSAHLSKYIHPFCNHWIFDGCFFKSSLFEFKSFLLYMQELELWNENNKAFSFIITHHRQTQSCPIWWVYYNLETTEKHVQIEN